MMTVLAERLQVQWFRPQQAAGTATQPTVVLLHEALGSIAQWRGFPQTLADATGLPVMAYDRCGFGGSQALMAPRGLDYLDRELASLDALLSACDIQRPLLFGHSDGATLALLYAAAFPERPLAVISEAAHLFVEEATLAGIRAVVQRWQNSDLCQRLSRYHGAKAETVFATWAETWLDPAFRSWNVEAQMAAVRCPVLALQGENDEFGTVRQLQAVVDGVGGRCRSCLLADCAHVPHRQAEAEVLAEVCDFLGELVAA
ncbi:alpha/beta hydrolase [Desulfuromonas carbonis]|nr:2-succinyl-6-hydroxy-2, 4-cyclohexadiene-1-carboxylate synthase [Desulfuromonas sp. DDH964]